MAINFDQVPGYIRREIDAPRKPVQQGVKNITVKCRIDTAVEIEYIENGGVLHYVLRNLAKAA